MRKNSYLDGLALVLAVALLLALTACQQKGSGNDSDESTSEMAAASFAGAANGSENNGSVVAFVSPRGLMEKIVDGLNPIQTAFAEGEGCPVLRTADCGDKGIIVLQFDACGRGRASWSGSETLEFSSLAVCQARQLARAVPVSGSLTRTFGDGTYRSVDNRKVTIDTSVESGYAQKVSGGEFVQYGLDGDDAVRTIDIKGIHLVATDGQSRKRWDHTISTDAAKPLKVKKAGAQKEITEGTTIVQHNLALFTATVDIKSPLTFSEGCCHPTGGSVTTTFSGSKSGSEDLTFTATCGVATLKAADGSEASLQLKHCF